MPPHILSEVIFFSLSLRKLHLRCYHPDLPESAWSPHALSTHGQREAPTCTSALPLLSLKSPFPTHKSADHSNLSPTFSTICHHRAKAHKGLGGKAACSPTTLPGIRLHSTTWVTNYPSFNWAESVAWTRASQCDHPEGLR